MNAEFKQKQQEMSNEFYKSVSERMEASNELKQFKAQFFHKQGLVIYIKASKRSSVSKYFTLNLIFEK